MFWRLPMPLPARALWYRVLSKKIPHGEYLYRIKDHRDSPLCTICKDNLEDFPHFVAFCPHKLYVWQTALSTFFPWLIFPPDIIFDTLVSLSVPQAIPPTSRSNYLLLVSTINFGLWKFYWGHAIHNTPFDAESILTYILQTISHLDTTFAIWLNNRTFILLTLLFPFNLSFIHLLLFSNTLPYNPISFYPSAMWDVQFL